MADGPLSFDSLDKLPDPLLSFKWVVESMPQDFGRMPSVYIESIDLPFYAVQIKEGIFGAGSYDYFPGYQNISAFDITFYEDRLMTTTKYLEAWSEKIRNRSSGLFYLPRSYKRDIVVALYDQANVKICTVTLIDVWPSTRGNMNLQYTDNDRVKIQQNFSVDNQEIEIHV